MTVLTRSVMLACLAALAAACGSTANGNGGDTDQPADSFTVLSVTPADGVTDAPIEGTISATFSQPVYSAMVNYSTMRLLRPDGSQLNAEYSVDAAIARLVPNEGLYHKTTYTVVLEPGIRAAQGGGQLTAAWSWSFTTVPNPADSDGPVLLDSLPLDGAQGVDPATPITLWFDEEVADHTIGPAAISLAAGGTPVDYTWSSTMQMDGRFRVTLTPSAPLAVETEYRLSLSTDLTDFFGNPLAAPVNLTFTTAPTPILPVVLGGPLVGATLAVYPVADLGDHAPLPVWTAVTSADPANLGLAPLDQDLLEPGSLYLLTITGGQDHDADGDGSLDLTPSPNMGRLCLLATGSELNTPAARISPLTTAACTMTRLLVAAAYPDAAALDRRDWCGRRLLVADLDGDGDTDHADLMAFDPATDAGALRKGTTVFHDLADSLRDGQDVYYQVERLESGVVARADGNGASALAQVGDHVLVADSNTWDSYGVVGVYDLSDPLAPVRVHEIQFSPGNIAIDMVVRGSVAYATLNNGGVSALDVTTPDAATEMARDSGFGSGAQRLDVDGTYIYLTSGMAMRIIDRGRFLAHASPWDVGSFSAAFNTFGLADVLVDGPIAYLANGPQGVEVVSVASPSSPSRVGWYHVGDNVSANGLAKQGDLLFVAAGTQLLILDVLDPTDPVLVGRVPTPGANQLRVDGNLVWVANSAATVTVYDVSDPTTPQLVAWIDLFDVAGIALDVLPVDGYGVVAFAQGGIVVVSPDVGVPLREAELGNLPTHDRALGALRAGDVLYLADGSSGLLLADIASPSAPTVLGWVDTPGTAQDVALAGQVALVADGAGGLQAIDVSVPASPGPPTPVDGTSGSVTRVLVTSQHALALQFGMGLAVFDASNPGAGLPHLVTHALPDLVAMTLDGTTLYMAYANGAMGVQAWDYGDPTAPVLLDATAGAYSEVLSVDGGSLYFSHSGYLTAAPLDDLSAERELGLTVGQDPAVTVSGGIVYVPDTGHGVVAYDLRGPVRSLGGYFAPGANGLLLDGDLLHAAAGPYGLRVLRRVTRRLP